MSANNAIVEKQKIIMAVAPVDMTDAGVTGVAVSLKNVQHVTVIIGIGAYAGGTPAVAFAQATNVAFGTTKALTDIDYSWKSDAAGEALTKSDLTAGTLNLAADDDTKYYIFEIDANRLDKSNGYDCFRCTVATPGTNADLICMFYILSGLRNGAGAVSLTD